MEKVKNIYDLDKLYFATTKGETVESTIVYIYEEYGVSYIIDAQTGQVLNPNRVEIHDILSDGLRKKGLSVLLQKSNGRRLTKLVLTDIVYIKRVIANKSKLDKKEVEEVKNISRLITNYVSDLLGLNITVNPSTRISLVEEDIENVLVSGTKLQKFKKLLAPFIEAALYERIDTPYEIVITSGDNGIDGCVEATLKRSGIIVSDTLRGNHFSLKASIDNIMVKGKNSTDYSLCYEKKGGKVMKISQNGQIWG